MTYFRKLEKIAVAIVKCNFCLLLWTVLSRPHVAAITKTHPFILQPPNPHPCIEWYMPVVFDLSSAKTSFYDS